MNPMKVFGWAVDHNGCGNYRIGMPMFALGLMGYDALAFSVLNVEIPSDLDIFVGQIVYSPDRTEVWRTLARSPGRHFGMIYEIDDDIWSLIPSNPSYQLYDQAACETAIQNIRMADAVTVTTDHLAEVVSKFNPNVFVLPNCVDASMLRYERPQAEKFTVGWAGGSSHGDDFHSAHKDLRTFFRRNPTVDTHLIGMNYGAELGRRSTRYTGWQSNLMEYMRCLDFDIGLAPLAYNAFNRSKSDLKYLEYAALGIPVVASDFGPYAESVEHGVTGMLVRYPHEWSKYLNRLVKDDQFRAEIGSNARAWAATRSIQANAWRWDEVYRKIAGL